MKFNEILGQESVKERLRAMIDNDRLPHALLLEGPGGTGKFMLARAAVQYLHCTNRTPEGDSCGHCPSCVQHQTFNHIDTIFSFPVLAAAGGKTSDEFLPLWRKFLTDSPYMDGELWQRLLGYPNGQPVIYVDESESIINKLSFSSHGADYKVVVMWLPEKMNNQCANKLLKLIEEPLPGVKMLFVADNAAEILPTIYSRMQRIEVKRLSDNDVAGYLTSHHNLDWVDAMAAANLAGGSILAAEKGLKDDGENHQFLELFQRLMRLAYQRKVGKLKQWSVDAAALGRETSARFFDYCARQLRENFIANIRIPELNYLNREERAFSQNFSPFINERNVEPLTAVFLKAKGDILGNGNAKIIYFDVAVKVILLLKS